MSKKAAPSEDPEPALSALKLYEETTSAEREVCMSLLPGREPPSVVSTTWPVVLPLASNSLSLPTDPDAVAYPDKTLISVSATGAIGGLATEVRKELRSQDAEYCARHFPGHVVLSPLDVVLARLGSSALVDKLTELKKVARNKLGQKLKEDLLANFINESKTPSKPEERCIDGRYWLSRLADVCCFVSSDNISCTRLTRMSLHRPLPLAARCHWPWTISQHQMSRCPR
ncbi:hypothetical protein B0H19DRAFT_1190498 [Mycena capillaripes]|nr:hypothetical protein B0H19DRAFT_1190498 [Mycena capillaripes]